MIVQSYDNCLHFGSQSSVWQFRSEGDIPSILHPLQLVTIHKIVSGDKKYFYSNLGAIRTIVVHWQAIRIFA
jgi:hypothetical protein